MLRGFATCATPRCDPAQGAHNDVSHCSAWLHLMTCYEGPCVKRTPRKSNAASAPRLGTPLSFIVAARLLRCWLESLFEAEPLLLRA